MRSCPYVGTAISTLLSQHMSAYIPEIRSDLVERGLLIGFEYLEPRGRYGFNLEYQYNLTHLGRYLSSYAVTNADRDKGFSFSSLILAYRYSF